VPYTKEPTEKELAQALAEYENNELDAKLDAIEATLAYTEDAWAKVSGVTIATKETITGLFDAVTLIVEFLREQS
jgi:hypothetical protein